MSNKFSPLSNSTSALLEFRIWSDATSHAIPFKSCTTTGKNRFELVTASLNDVLPMWNGSTPRPPLKPLIFPARWFVLEKHVVEDDVLFTKWTHYNKTIEKIFLILALVQQIFWFAEHFGSDISVNVSNSCKITIITLQRCRVYITIWP